MALARAHFRNDYLRIAAPGKSIPDAFGMLLPFTDQFPVPRRNPPDPAKKFPRSFAQGICS
jgi:hypothetical protein